MKTKKILKEILTDVKHWLGWALETGGVYYILQLMNYRLTILQVLILLAVIVFIDSIKHTIRLQ